MKKTRTYGLMESIGLLKMLKMMRFTIFVLFLSLSQAFAVNTYSQQTRLNLDMKNARVEEVIDRIEKSSEFYFMYNKGMVDVDRKVDIVVEGQLVSQILDKLFENTDITYSIKDRQIMLINSQLQGESKEAPTQQQKKVSGKVTDSTGSTLPGVSVVVKGTTIGVITDNSGKYSFSDIPENATLIFSFVGMKAEEVKVGTQTSINVVMSEETVGIEEVVAIGYGTAKKSDLTGAISKVTSDDLKDRSKNNVIPSLAGKVAGVQILQTDGTAGYSPTVKIRGAASITSGTSPLYVIDGIPIEGANLNFLNPSDIESMEILKDASSAAIYGSRGSNGVVLITTKSGKTGKTNIEVNYEHGVSKLLNKIDMMNSQQYIQFYVDAHNNSWIADKGGKASDPNSARPLTYQVPPEFLSDPGKFATTNWQDVIFRVGNTDNFSFSMYGGNDKTKFMISSSFLNQQGIVDRNDFRRYTLRANLTHKITSDLTIGTNILLTKRDENPMVGYNMTPEIGKQSSVSNSLQDTPIYPVYNENGNLGGPFDPNSTWSRFLPYGIAYCHPYVHTREMDRLNQSLNTLSNLFIEWKFLPDFTFKSAISTSIDYSVYSAYLYNKAGYGWDQLPDSRAYYSHDYHFNWLSENTVSYNKTIGKHSINAFAGFTAQKDHYESGNILATGFPNDQVHTLNAATTATSFSSSATEWSLLSYIGRVNYTYQSKYLLTGTIRRDGSSRFGENTKWGYFPSASAGWRLTEEDFMKSVKWIDNLKLRLSYGVTGNNLIPNYGSVGLLGQSQYAWGVNAEPGLYVNTIANPDLKWEKTGQWDLGLNVGLFANRIYLEADYYQSVTRDMLLNVPVPAITGFTSQLTNIGKLQNKGFEFLISTKNLIGDFKWNTDFNISTNRNKVMELGPDGAPIYSNNWGSTKTEIGQPIANFYGYIFDGVFMNQNELNSYPHAALATPGDPRIRDVNGDGKIDANDRTTIGNAQPDFTFGLTNTFKYKGFDFSFTLQGQVGNEIMNSQARFSKTYNGGRNQYAVVANYWKSASDPGDGTFFKPMLTYNALQSAFSSYWVEDGSFLRIRNVQFGYNLPARAISWSHMASARVYVNAENLYVLTHYHLGFDPENSVFASGLDLGNDYGATPMPRTVTMGVKINF